MEGALGGEQGQLSEVRSQAPVSESAQCESADAGDQARAVPLRPTDRAGDCQESKQSFADLEQKIEDILLGDPSIATSSR